ncbi:LytR/AlgR family response regulator transcription factor [Flagellimonas meridianipacifica]|uniref:DNA-binding LytR/AlgR family response regulator n=1 Tax=Flagellimonas meridianipacifica TaxID=1080225 RepID=A0A2T0MAR2_9FLAO|nr:LytTR family DNA-binding domain-containing protein [Allomuricauda pacifica]PRX54575.1 DNA-binding LytR/AlgR family response regulator [Allomuricauda pacifica]
MTYSCLIVDDEPLAQELIEEYVSKIPELKVVGKCNNALEASSFLTKGKVDLLFLDINMPVIKGIQFFKTLVDKPQVIFTTAHREYALDGFEVSALDYLLKPIVFERFFLAAQKFFKAMEKKSTLEEKTLNEVVPIGEFVFVSQGHRKIKVELDKVKYIESFKDYIKIHTTTENIQVKENIGVFEKRLNTNFLRVHRSYIINMRYLTGYTKLDAEMGEQELPIGPSYREKVLSFFERLQVKNS